MFSTSQKVWLHYKDQGVKFVRSVTCVYSENIKNTQMCWVATWTLFIAIAVYCKSDYAHIPCDRHSNLCFSPTNFTV